MRNVKHTRARQFLDSPTLTGRRARIACPTLQARVLERHTVWFALCLHCIVSTWKRQTTSLNSKKKLWQGDTYLILSSYNIYIYIWSVVETALHLSRCLRNTQYGLHNKIPLTTVIGIMKTVVWKLILAGVGWKIQKLSNKNGYCHLQSQEISWFPDSAPEEPCCSAS